MKRFTVVVAAAALFGALWVSSFFGVIERALAPTTLAPRAPAVVDAVQHAPFHAHVVFGCYALATIGANLFTFNDCEEAAAGLTEASPARGRRRAGRRADAASRVCDSDPARAERAPLPYQDVNAIKASLAARGFKGA